MMLRVLALASATYREGVRSNVFANLVVLAVFAAGGALLVDQLAVGVTGRVVVDVGLALASMVGALLCALVTARTMGGEEDRHVLLTVLVRPVARAEIVVGKYLGVVALAWTNATACTALAGAGRMLLGTPPDASVAQMWGTLLAESVLVSAVAFLFATLAGTTVAVVLTLTTYACGLVANALLELATRAPDIALAVVARAFFYAVPNLERMDMVKQPPGDGAWVPLVLYVAAYATTAVGLACAVFERKDLR